jgi:intracellular sulfur oxidation DsrE/DsrF family protein
MKVILFGSEYIGRGDDTLGFSIMVEFFEALLRREEKPVALIFWNEAVKLLTRDSPCASRIKTLEDKGVKVLAGRLCVNELGISEKLYAGTLASMDEILNYLLKYEVISL